MWSSSDFLFHPHLCRCFTTVLYRFLIMLCSFAEPHFFWLVFKSCQKPLWCSKYSAHSCTDREYFFLGQLPYLTITESLIYEVRSTYVAEFLSVFLSGRFVAWEIGIPSGIASREIAYHLSTSVFFVCFECL